MPKNAPEKYDDHNFILTQLGEVQKNEKDQRELARECKNFVTKTDGQWEDTIWRRVKDLGRPRYTFDRVSPIIDMIVGELESMQNVADREKFISDVITADSELVASFLRLEAQMMASYHQKISPGLRIVDADGKISFLQVKDKTMVAFLPLDYVASTIDFWKKENQLSRSLDKIGPASGKQMWITGTVTSDARKGLEMRGWKVMDNAAKKLFR